MNVTLNITLSELDHTALLGETKGSVSEALREIFASIEVDQETLRKQIGSHRTSCVLDVDVAEKLSKLSNELHVPPARIARALVEIHLHNQQHNQQHTHH